MPGFFIPGFPKLQRFQAHHELILSKMLPKLKKHLVSTSVREKDILITVYSFVLRKDSVESKLYEKRKEEVGHAEDISIETFSNRLLLHRTKSR